MARVPLVGRLYFREYVALVLSFFLVTLEFLARIITLTLPAPIINFLYSRSRALFKLLPSTKESKINKKSSSEIVKKIRDADGFVEMCEIWGYEAEEHIVQTKDGYLLGLHRIPRAKDEPKPKRGEKGKEKKGVVYLHHGLMMNSEVWVCNIQPEKCLPFVLAEQGYDVWVGSLHRVIKLLGKGPVLTLPVGVNSWATIEEINTPRSAFIRILRIRRFGTLALMNLRCMIFRIRFLIFCCRRRPSRYLMLGLVRERRRLLLVRYLRSYIIELFWVRF